jgi:hypothetical protein
MYHQDIPDASNNEADSPGIALVPIELEAGPFVIDQVHKQSANKKIN